MPRTAAARGTPAAQRKTESEVKKLHEITRDTIPKAKRGVAMALMRNAAWMKVKLDEARADMMEAPLVIDYDNGGGQAGKRENPAFSAYNKLFASYSRAIKQLTDLMGTDASSERDELADFLNETRL